MSHQNNEGLAEKVYKAYINSFNLKLASALVTSALVIIYLHFAYPSYNESLKFITAVILSFSAIFSAVFVGKGLSNQIHFDKLKNSFDATRSFNSHEYNELKEVCKREYDAKVHSPEKLVEKVETSEDLFYKLKAILNQFEDLSLAIQKGFVNEEVLYWALDLILRFYVDNFRSYIDESRKDDKEVYCELLKLYESWNNRKYLSTGKPVGDSIFR